MQNIHFFHRFDSVAQGSRWTHAPPPPNTPLRPRSGLDMILGRNISVHGRLQDRLDEIISGPKQQTDFDISRNMVNPRTFCFT
jgi:hypothetical protein